MSSSLIPRIAEIPLNEFDAECQRAEIEHHSELEQMISELEEAAQLVDLPSCDYFSGARKKMRRFLTPMSFLAAYTPAEFAQALGPGYAFKGRMSGLNYILVAHRKTG